jgi:hypothetical protein
MHRFALAALLLLAAVGLVAGVAHGRSFDVVHRALLSIPAAHEDRKVEPAIKAAQMANVSEAIKSVTSNRRERAMLMTIGWHETKFAIRLGENRCNPWECDGGRARHYWQTHQHGLTDAEWEALVGTDLETTKRAARHALRLIRRSYAMCRSLPDPIRATLYAYGSGRGCVGTTKTLDARVAMVKRIEARL